LRHYATHVNPSIDRARLARVTPASEIGELLIMVEKSASRKADVIFLPSETRDWTMGNTAKSSRANRWVVRMFPEACPKNACQLPGAQPEASIQV